MDSSLQKSVDHGAIDAEALVRDNIGWMLKLAARLVRDRTTAEDVVQEAFMRALRSLDRFEGRSTIETWLRRITINTALTRLKKLERLAEQPIDEHLPEFDRLDCRIETRWTHLVSVEDVMANEERRDRVRRTIGELPDAYRVVLQLRDIEGYATAEVADLLDISEANVKVRLHRARAALKKLLEPLLRDEDMT